MPENPGKYNENPHLLVRLDNMQFLSLAFLLDFLCVLNLNLPLVCFLVLLRAPAHPKPSEIWVSFVIKTQKRPISCTFTGFRSVVLPTPLSSNAFFSCLLLFFLFTSFASSSSFRPFQTFIFFLPFSL